ncbi:MAG: AAA family ATPase [Methylococcaceae bacterium]|nr:AAA family ATPase [Methylococcaceae bacterium]
MNPAGYIAYRGADHGMTEERYNQKLAGIAKENDIKVIGLADHGNVDSVDAVRAVMERHGIVVFPGFEIASAEKAHFVCLFPEDTSKDQLNRYLGSLGLTKSDNGVWPSNFGGKDLLAKVDELGGFAYAAHCTHQGSGILDRRLVHVWQNPQLKAVQIPATIDDLKNDEGQRYREILLNKTPEYKRETAIAIINAKDVEQPETLANPKASCLIKMTRPCFESFRLAFQDPESRVRLNSEVGEKYYSRIESLTVTGGYLDGVNIEFSEHLNAVIGGRGTGKSTLLECIRFCLQLRPMGKNAQKQHDEIIKENLGKSKARVEIVIRSSRMNGKLFTVARRYGESASVKDESGGISAFQPLDLLPAIEIYGQNEIYEIAQDSASQRQLLCRFLETDECDGDKRIREILGKLAENRKRSLEAQGNVASIEDEVARLPKLEERLGQFKTLGLEEKLKIVPLLETEKRLQQRVIEEESQNLDKAFQSVRDCLPDTAFLSDAATGHLPHAEILRKLRTVLDGLRTEAENLLGQWTTKYADAKASIEALNDELTGLIQQEEMQLEQTFKELPALEGRTGKAIGYEYQDLLKEIERIRPKMTLIENRRKVVTELNSQRKAILDELSSLRANRSAQFEKALKRLNKRLSGKLKLTVIPEAERHPVIQFLLNCQLESVAEGRLAWIRDAENFSPVKLAELIRLGSDAIRNAGWNVTPTVADALSRLGTEQVLQLEELELPDSINIELNIAHEGRENFKPLDKLSTGQQCTAILHLLLLQNLDPLIMDQPEDNLDNAFIADRIVAELRSAKIARQFIFATHNANIPVFGDAEWIGVLEEDEGQARMPSGSQGAIDVPQVRDKAADILEGGKTAFIQRKAKYGY